MTKEELEAFEADIAAEFNAGRIKAPIHLAGGNENDLISIFRDIRPQDWVIGQWRMHYHCLLKGVPPAELKAAIMAGHSITLCFPQYRVLSSAIAGGHLPIALGIAWQIKREGRDEVAYCFMGDMVAEMGIAHECIKYAASFDLPIRWIVENNGKSVCTDTKDAWGKASANYGDGSWFNVLNVATYRYDLPWPHSGAGQRVNF